MSKCNSPKSKCLSRRRPPTACGLALPCQEVEENVTRYERQSWELFILNERLHTHFHRFEDHKGTEQ
jgi:hypothetical protein